MKRVKEDHELMDDIIAAQAYAEMDFSEPHNLFVKKFREKFPDFSKGNVLDIGCGDADPTIRFAKAYPDTQVVALDGSASMLKFAQAAVERESLTNRIHCVEVRLQKYAPGGEVFDVVICNSSLHHIDPASALWKAIKRVIKEGALVFVMDFFRPETIEEVNVLVDRHAKDSPEEERSEGFRNSLLAAYTPEEVYDQLRQAGLESFRVEVISDRHMIIFGTLKGGDTYEKETHAGSSSAV